MLISYEFFCCKILVFSFFIRGANIYNSSVPAKKSVLFFMKREYMVYHKIQQPVGVGLQPAVVFFIFFTSSYLLFHRYCPLHLFAVWIL